MWSQCPGMHTLVTLVALRSTSSCHPRIPPAALWSTEPAGRASSPSRNPICLDPLDIPSVLWSRGFRICLCSCIAQWLPKRAPPPLLPLLWVLRSGQCAEIAPDLHATAAEKRGPFDRLLQHVALPNFTCCGTWSIRTTPQKLVRSRGERQWEEYPSAVVLVSVLSSNI